MRRSISSPRAAVNRLPAMLRAGRGAGRGKLVAANGDERDVYLSVTTASSDNVVRRNMIVADLSDLIGAESDRDRAERENRAKDEFIAMLGHELRNPLGAIVGAVQVLDAIEPADCCAAARPSRHQPAGPTPVAHHRRPARRGAARHRQDRADATTARPIGRCPSEYRHDRRK